MERTFALIRGTTVENHVVADDSFVEFIKDQYDDVIETTDMDFKPSPGFGLLEDGTFVNPYQATFSVENTDEEIIDAEVIEPTLSIDAPVEGE